MSSEQLKKEVEQINLDELTQMREEIPVVTFPISDRELLARYEKLYTGAISDVLRGFCYLNQALPNRIKPLREYRTVAGFAFTVKSAPNVMLSGELELRTQMLDVLGENTFVVWDTSGDEKATLWGGIMASTAKEKKVRAACIDGGIRDTHQILEADFPIFYKYRICNGSLGRCLITHYQIPILIGDVLIKPGYVIVGDIDGVIVVPRDIAYKVLLKAEEVIENEKKIFNWVHEGQTVYEITEKGGYF